MAGAAYDAIVVGSGINGLAAAIHLAAKGWSVAVIEAAEAPGGAVRTTELTVPGFRHDMAAMNLSMFAGSPFFAAYRDELLEARLSLAPASHCFASIYRDDTYLGVSADSSATRVGIEALSAHDAAAWDAMIEDFGRTAPHLFGLLGSAMPSAGVVRKLWAAWRQLGTEGLLRLARIVVGTPRGFLSEHFESEKVQTMMASWGLHLDFPPDVAGGALFPFLETMATQAFGMVIGKGGADTVITAMVALLQRHRGIVMLDCKVDEVEIDGTGKACGVRLADGRTLKARKAVIANLHPKVLFGSLVTPARLPETFHKKVSRFRSGPGAMMIHVASEAPLAWTAGSELQKYAYVHLAPDLGMMSRVYAEAMDGLLPAEPALIVGQPSAIDPSRAPAGKHVHWIQVRVVPALIRGDASGQITGTDWSDVKELYADRVFDLIERYAPGMKQSTIARTVYSPLDLAKFNPNLVGGDSLGGSHHLDQNFLLRPFIGYSRYKTPVRSLYMCGASTWPGAGTGGTSGFLLGKMLAGS